MNILRFEFEGSQVYFILQFLSRKTIWNIIFFNIRHILRCFGNKHLRHISSFNDFPSVLFYDNTVSMIIKDTNLPYIKNIVLWFLKATFKLNFIVTSFGISCYHCLKVHSKSLVKDVREKGREMEKVTSKSLPNNIQ